VLSVNDDQRRMLVDRISAYYDGDLQGKQIAVWGLAFKPNTDDVRESPAHVIIEGLLEAGATVRAFDPEAMETTRVVLGDRIAYVEEGYDALEGADCLVICTEWNEFRRPDFDRIRSLLNAPVVFDGRNLYDPKRMAEQGFEYFSIGRPYFKPVVSPQHDSVATANGTRD
jgi:UDPglucose 6-dehydrogenase